MLSYTELNKEFLEGKGKFIKDLGNGLQPGTLGTVDKEYLYCVSCGSHNLTFPILKFFNFDPAELRCYNCQKL